MGLAEFIEQLESLQSSALQTFGDVTSVDDLEQARVDYLGAKNGQLKAVQKQMGQVEKSDKPTAGKRFNEIKQAIEQGFETAKSRLEAGDGDDEAGHFGLANCIPSRRRLKR